MHLHSVVIENCKSFREREEVHFSDRSTVFVGPNGGGKSNTLDIITVVLRHFFIHSYTRQDDDAGVHRIAIAKNNLFSAVPSVLAPHFDKPTSDVKISLTLKVGAADLENIGVILARKDDFEKAQDNYAEVPHRGLRFLQKWDASDLYVGQEVSYNIVDYKLAASDDNAAQVIQEYLQTLHYFMILSRDIECKDIRPVLAYFSPYRMASSDDLHATLAADRFFSVLHRYLMTTSHTTTALIKLATVYFSEKKREMESARNRPWPEAWCTDEDVMAVTNYLSRIGFTWDLPNRNLSRNVYEVLISDNNRTFGIANASSGEKEILNYIFGIVALGIRDGIIVVDEPELHLHPRWQVLLRELFTEMAILSGNQFVVSTHSSSFITTQTINSVRRVAKDATGTTRVIQIEADESSSDRHLLHLINVHNNEKIFFADKIVLVEGIHDRLVFNRLVDLCLHACPHQEVIEVIEVHSKHNFSYYRDYVQRLHVPDFLIADIDYLLDVGGSNVEMYFETSWKRLSDNVLKNKKSDDRLTLAEMLDESIRGGDNAKLQAFWQYLQQRHKKLKAELSEEDVEGLRSIIAARRAYREFVLFGEIESYLPHGYRKLEETITLMKPDKMMWWFEDPASKFPLDELLQICMIFCELDPSDVDRLREQIVARLRNEVRLAERGSENRTHTVSVSSGLN